MKIPRKKITDHITIMGREFWVIESVECPWDKRVMYAGVHWGKRLIWLSKNLTKQSRKENLIHEILETILYYHGIRKNSCKFRRLSHAIFTMVCYDLTEALQNNGLLK